MKNEIYIRMIFFLGVFAVIAVWEILAPRLAINISKLKRWYNNLSIILVNSLIVRLLIPVIPVAIAVKANSEGLGLLYNLNINYYVGVIIGVIILDFAIYLQHLMFHAVPLLWRLHMVHHADLGIDVTTGLRFHPVEIILSLFIKIAVIIVIGAPPLAVLIFEILLNATAMFNHGNIYINPWLDKILRLLVVTPDMHRVHHSVIIRETNSNFGFNLPWWDRLFGTYRDQPSATHEGIVIGLSQYRSHMSLSKMLVLPFVGVSGNYSINRWGREPGEKKRARQEKSAG